MIASIPSSTLIGIDGFPVVVEVHVSNGLPQFNIVGLPDAACREARDRVRSAMLSSGLDWVTRRITVNLAPSNLKKVGTAFDLAIAVGLLVANGKIPVEAVEGMAFLGELGLDGSVRPINGVVPLVDALNANAVVVPEQCVSHAQLIERHQVCGVSSLSQMIAALAGEGEWVGSLPTSSLQAKPGPDLADVRGQPLAKWAVEVAATGGHNIVMVGSPGSGKTMLARRLPGLLPDLDSETALTATRIHSAGGLLHSEQGLVTRPPFRSPHHTASMTSLVGGGAAAAFPGEVSYSHGGVLFLDELAEFSSSALDALREPLEEGVVRITRVQRTMCYPARFLCIGAMNPCPCGDGLIPGACKCSDASISRYTSRISGPFMDRFDLRLVVQPPKIDQLLGAERGESSERVLERVAAAREFAIARGVRCNADLSGRELEDVTKLDSASEALVRHQMRKGTLTARGLTRIRRVARTLADLDGGSAVLNEKHVYAALELRMPLNRLDKAS